MIDVWSRKVVAWDVAGREDPAIAVDLVSRACLRADQQGTEATADPQCVQRQRHARSLAGKPHGRTGRPQIVLTAARQQRQPLLGSAVQDGEVST